MKLTIRSMSTWEAPNLRVWCPENDLCFAQSVTLAIGPKPGNKTDGFSRRVATPAGLAQLEAEEGILASGPVLILVRYDFDILWNWTTRVVRSCESTTWPYCVENLRRYFSWEYDGYKI